MKVKNFLLILIGFLFLAVCVFVFITAFTVKKVAVSFSTFEDAGYSVDLQTSLDKFVGSNLLFLDTASVNEIVEQNPYCELVSVKKSFPNVLSVEIKERREVYLFDFETKTYILSEEGYILTVAPDNIERREYISLSLEDIVITDFTFGSKIKTTDDEMLFSALSMCSKVRLTDCIKSVTVKSAPTTDISLPLDTKQAIVTFGTYTEVDIVIYDALNLGDEKVNKAFSTYNDKASDYNKINKGKIEAYCLIQGIVRVIWTRDGNVVFDSSLLY